MCVADPRTPEQRSANMARIASRNTKPELAVRKMLHAAGYRYRLHDRNLPGTPDLVFPARRKVIFVHGCFWHMHDCPRGKSTPKSNAAFWQEKRLRNVRRDEAQMEELDALGWCTAVVWECEIRKSEELVRRIASFLGTPRFDNSH